MSGLTPKQRKRLGKYVRHVADELGLRDWVIHIEHAPLDADDPAMAVAVVPYGRSDVTLRFRGDFVHIDPDEQRMIVVHELLHCHLPSRRADDMWGVGPLIGQAAATVLEERYRYDIESIVDRLAVSIAPSFEPPVLSGKVK